MMMYFYVDVSSEGQKAAMVRKVVRTFEIGIGGGRAVISGGKLMSSLGSGPVIYMLKQMHQGCTTDLHLNGNRS